MGSFLTHLLKSVDKLSLATGMGPDLERGAE